MYHKLLQRTALIADLVRKAPSAFGRTALLKFLQVLQTVRRVPLGYYFGLYTYGPLNVDVLSDSIKVCSVRLHIAVPRVYPAWTNSVGREKALWQGRVGGRDAALGLSVKSDFDHRIRSKRPHKPPLRSPRYRTCAVSMFSRPQAVQIHG